VTTPRPFDGGRALASSPRHIMLANPSAPPSAGRGRRGRHSPHACQGQLREGAEVTTQTLAAGSRRRARWFHFFMSFQSLSRFHDPSFVVHFPWTSTIYTCMTVRGRTLIDIVKSTGLDDHRHLPPRTIIRITPTPCGHKEWWPRANPKKASWLDG